MVSTGVRLLTNLVLFVVLAHVWGPATFGVFMYPYAIAAILVRIVDYGFTLQIARDVGREPTRTHDIVGRALGAKLILLVPTIATSAIVAARLPDGPPYTLLLTLLVADALATSFALFLNIPLRSLGRFDREATVAIGANLTFFTATITAGLAGFGPVAVALIFLLARLAFLGLACRGYAQVVGGRPRIILDRLALTETLTKGFPFAVHTVVGTISLQVDALMIQHYMGASAVGLHQAGMRLLLGALVVGDALHNVFFASLVRVAHDARELGRQATRMTRHFVALGILAFACLLGAAEAIVGALFDVKFAQLTDLLPLFGLAVLVRYAGLAYGAVLTLADRQMVRVLAAGGVLGLNLVLALVLVPRFGIPGALIASTMSDLALHIVCAVAAWGQYRDFMIDRRAVVLLLCAAAALPVAVPGAADHAPRAMAAAMLAAAALIVGPTRGEWSSLTRAIVDRLPARFARAA
jgi:O-antigen/teichoic acid export membrane protein